jgi:S-adenosylmethionine:tRNA ribosyltransferase-isomerase
MRTSDFNYDLPPELIAQTPVEPRDSSRLLVLFRDSGKIEHRIFREIGQFLHTDDLLVINRTRVISARIHARKPSGGRVEILLLKREDQVTWECLVGGKGLSAGRQIAIDNGPSFVIIEALEGSRRRIRFSEPVEPFLPKVGTVPLPPYIHEPIKDPERYQTVYARDPGSAAAPTAGLHFTPQLISDLKDQNVKFAEITLHVGLDTFAPVTEENPEEHLIHTEWCEIPPTTVEAITKAHQSGGRVIAVGTTSVRTLESATGAGKNGIISYSGPTSLFILPGYKFKCVDGLITNFHLPKSSLIMLVSAFAGSRLIKDVYNAAIRENYRFYSFGDAMIIL